MQIENFTLALQDRLNKLVNDTFHYIIESIKMFFVHGVRGGLLLIIEVSICGVILLVPYFCVRMTFANDDKSFSKHAYKVMILDLAYFILKYFENYLIRVRWNIC